MEVILFLSLCILGVTAPPPDPKIPPEVEPAYLDMLLEEKRYDEFSSYLGIDNTELVIPKGGTGRSRQEAMRNKNLERGDILPLPPMNDEEDRQAIRMDKYRGSLWQRSPSFTNSKPVYDMPYAISNQFSSNHKNVIERSIRTWNNQVPCLKMVSRTSQKDYLNIFPGQGCWSYLGRTGGAQALSLDPNGCVYDSTVLHEAKHAAGFTHEQNRFDRDGYIKMLWDNIPDEWKDQYKKVDNNDWENMGNYDYYSVMHYGVTAPGTNKPAYEVLDRSIDKNKIGNGKGFTDEDIRNLNQMYCRTY